MTLTERVLVWLLSRIIYLAFRSEIKQAELEQRIYWAQVQANADGSFSP